MEADALGGWEGQGTEGEGVRTRKSTFLFEFFSLFRVSSFVDVSLCTSNLAHSSLCGGLTVGGWAGVSGGWGGEREC